VTTVLELEDLVVEYRASGRVRALDGASLTVKSGESWGIVGESGSGKSTLALALAGALPADVASSGGLRYLGRDMLAAPVAWWREYRQRELGAIFQDPMGALDPTMKVGRQLMLAVGGRYRGEARGMLFDEHFGAVSLPAPRETARKYSWELSGGMAQRVAIAIALANDPRLLVADEPTSALDAGVRGRVVGLLHRVQREHERTSIVFTHDLNAVERLATHVAVMYAGRVVESGSAELVLGQPRHPYTRALLACAPGLEGRRERLEAIGGAPPVLHEASSGCAFADRCPLVIDRCRSERPRSEEVGARLVACFRAGTDGA